MKISSRSAVDAFIVMDVLQAAQAAEAAGRDVVHMEIGQPATGAPEGARRALADAMQNGPLGYTAALGLAPLRARIARHYGAWYDVDLDPARVVITAGASAGFILGFTALFDAGDRVGLGEPCYPSYRQILRALDLQPVGFATSIANRLQPVPGDLPADLDGLIVASPANPSGTMLSQTALTALIEACHERGVSFISDEIYHGIHYDDRPVSALEISDDLYVINSFSKYFSMTGWRIGWMVVPENHVRTVERLAQNLFICAPHASQFAALAAMDCTEELEANVAVYRANRTTLIEGLNAAGLTAFAPPDGAFYIYVDVSDITDDSYGMARDMLEKVDVAVTPGLDFDPHRGHQTLRFSYAGAPDDIARGVERIKTYMKQR